MMKKHVLLILTFGVLFGCSSQQNYAGKGEYFELMNLNLLEADLSVFKPTQIATTPEVLEPQRQIVSVTIAPENELSFVVRKGERYQAAIKRWLREEGYPSVAWSMNTMHSQAIDSVSEKMLTFKSNNFKKAIKQLSDELKFTINVIVDEQNNVAGIYDFEGEARITHVSGKSLKTVVQRVAENYGLVWVDDSSNKRSWRLVGKDYEFSADYYLLTRFDDYSTALATVLEEYPVYSGVVESTRQVFIQEEQ
ncbi:hypothetical protein Q5N41_16790 [Vibrio cholerae]|uniref:hypothetical protein n=1 Tax=Vibrio TaxID=662 RepID=UPI000A55E4B9|nr:MULTISPECIES: hypothetical protein [Vibrio]MDV2319060.1 hypothetical protein [Vibrio cholerae]MDV2380031.1 hypothetical protein [Vibrio cholerae]